MFLCGLLLSSLHLTAQSLEIGISGGTFLYSGDLSRHEFGIYLHEVHPAYGVFGRLNLNPWLSARLAVQTGQLEVEDARPQRGLNFRTHLTEASMMGEFRFWHIGTPETALQAGPYLVAGVGLFHFAPQGRFDGEWVSLQPVGTEGQGLSGYDKPYTLTCLQVPLGLGFDVTINRRVTIGLEFSGRKTFTDYLDDVSNAQVNFRDIVLEKGLTAARLSNPSLDPEGDLDITYRRGGPYDDWYFFAGIHLSVRLGNGDGKHNATRDPGCYRF